MATTLLRRPAPSVPLLPSVARRRAITRPRPELLGLLLLAAVLDLWGLARNGYANEYYSAAVRSMSSSWHAFLFGSFDASGTMTVDKPPLALWMQVASVKVFGFHPLSLLVPQAGVGGAAGAPLYDPTRPGWGGPPALWPGRRPPPPPSRAPSRAP